MIKYVCDICQFESEEEMKPMWVEIRTEYLKVSNDCNEPIKLHKNHVCKKCKEHIKASIKDLLKSIPNPVYKCIESEETK